MRRCHLDHRDCRATLPCLNWIRIGADVGRVCRDQSISSGAIRVRGKSGVAVLKAAVGGTVSMTAWYEQRVDGSAACSLLRTGQR